MRVSNWNPQKFDGEIMTAAMDRLENAAKVVADAARSRVRVGTIARTGKPNGKEWKDRQPGTLKKSIRVVRLKDDKRRNVRVYAGNYQAFYARFVEYGTAKTKAKPFLRPALNASKAAIQGILRNGE